MKDEITATFIEWKQQATILLPTPDGEDWISFDTEEEKNAYMRENYEAISDLEV